MKYIERHLERKFLHMNSFFKAVMITGARQVGKTTMLKHLAESTNRNYVALDNISARMLAKNDPVLFFQTYKPPIIIDEVQYAPELFSQIKIICDSTEETGLFWIAGSQSFSMMKNVRESLAGRIAILEMYSMSQSEKNEIKYPNDLDFSLSNLLERQKHAPKNDIETVFEHIWQGGMPRAIEADEEQRQEYLNTYINTYLMRDVAELGGITDTLRFAKFLTACASLISEQVNYKTIADSAEISQPTAKEWIRLLEGLGIIYLLRPYSNNSLKRLTKTPKLYFCDTGLAAYLSMWLTTKTLQNGASSGHFFENYVIIELLKNYAYAKSKVNLTYFRDANTKEIDVFIEENNTIHPIEIKKSSAPDKREVKKFNVLESISIEVGSGGIICMCEEVSPIDEKNSYIPCNII